jgi:hypothetical protein
MDNKEKIEFLVLKTFYDNIPYKKYFGLKFTAIWIMGAVTLYFVIKLPAIISLPISFLLFLILMITLCGYSELKDTFLSEEINNDYIEKVMDKIKHQFSSKNNIHLKESDSTEYPENVQVVINDLIKNLTSKQNLATYNDIIELYEKTIEKYEEYEEKVKKHEQTEMMEKYVKE